MEDKQIDLLKMEYEVAAGRYENIYRAIWQQFSYLAAVSGAILAFGPKSGFPLVLVETIALVPLVFWLLATFIPMDRYGIVTKNRLAQIEENLNELSSLSDKDEKFWLSHFRGFYGESNLLVKWRVRHAVLIIGFIAMLGLSYLSYRSYDYYTDKPKSSISELIQEVDAIEQKLKASEIWQHIELASRIDSLQEQLGNINELVQEADSTD